MNFFKDETLLEVVCNGRPIRLENELVVSLDDKVQSVIGSFDRNQVVYLAGSFGSGKTNFLYQLAVAFVNQSEGYVVDISLDVGAVSYPAVFSKFIKDLKKSNNYFADNLDNIESYTHAQIVDYWTSIRLCIESFDIGTPLLVCIDEFQNLYRFSEYRNEVCSFLRFVRTRAKSYVVCSTSSYKLLEAPEEFIGDSPFEQHSLFTDFFTQEQVHDALIRLDEKQRINGENLDNTTELIYKLTRGYPALVMYCIMSIYKYLMLNIPIDMGDVYKGIQEQVTMKNKLSAKIEHMFDPDERRRIWKILIEKDFVTYNTNLTLHQKALTSGLVVKVGNNISISCPFMKSIFLRYLFRIENAEHTNFILENGDLDLESLVEYLLNNTMSNYLGSEKVSRRDDKKKGVGEKTIAALWFSILSELFKSSPMWKIYYEYTIPDTKNEIELAIEHVTDDGSDIYFIEIGVNLKNTSGNHSCKGHYLRQVGVYAKKTKNHKKSAVLMFFTSNHNIRRQSLFKPEKKDNIIQEYTDNCRQIITQTY